MEQCCYKPKFQVGDLIKYKKDSFVTIVRQIIDTEDECYVAKLIFVKNHNADEYHEMIRECYNDIEERYEKVDI